jgi:hypothetical protein
MVYTACVIHGIINQICSTFSMIRLFVVSWLEHLNLYAFARKAIREPTANPSVIQAGAKRASDRFAHIQTRDMVDIPTAYT